MNFERAIFYQKSINTLFLEFFEKWVSSEDVAKKFLLDLDGFDFLLNRLFCSKDKPLDQKEEEKKEEDLPFEELVAQSDILNMVR